MKKFALLAPLVLAFGFAAFAHEGHDHSHDTSKSAVKSQAIEAHGHGADDDCCKKGANDAKTAACCKKHKDGETQACCKKHEGKVKKSSANAEKPRHGTAECCKKAGTPEASKCCKKHDAGIEQECCKKGLEKKS